MGWRRLWGATLLVLGVAHGWAGAEESRLQAQVRALAESSWQDYIKDKPGFAGTLVVHWSSPAGNVTACAGAPVTDPGRAHFRAASITKSFTAAGIVLLAQQGKLRLDDPIGATIPGRAEPYLPEDADYRIPYRERITIRQLLQHRAGVFDVSNTDIPRSASAAYAGKRYIDVIRSTPGQDGHTFTFDELAGVISKNQLSSFPPEERFQYSNGGYALLGKILERVSGQSYADFMQQNFLTPLGMSSSRFVIRGDDQKLQAPYVPGFVRSQGSDLECSTDNMSPHGAEGNLLSTPEELALWFSALYTGRTAVGMPSVLEMADVLPTAEVHRFYGLGTAYTPGLGYGHDGAHIGYLSTCRYDPSTREMSVIYVSNLNADGFVPEARWLESIAVLLRSRLGRRDVDLKTDRIDSSPLHP